MPKLRLTFEVEPTKLFDAVARLKGDCNPIGRHIVGVLLTGEASFREAVGLELYGVQVSHVEKIENSQGPSVAEISAEGYSRPQAAS